MATAKVASPRPSQPTGAAYQPRSNGSCRTRKRRAASAGSPPTAGVGCRASSRSATPTPDANSPERRLIRCWTEGRRSTVVLLAVVAVHRSLSAAAIASCTMRCSSTSLADAVSSRRRRWSSLGEVARGRVPAIASVRTVRPDRENSRSGVTLTKAVPGRGCTRKRNEWSSARLMAASSAAGVIGAAAVAPVRRATTTLRSGSPWSSIAASAVRTSVSQPARSGASASRLRRTGAAGSGTAAGGRCRSASNAGRPSRSVGRKLQASIVLPSRLTASKRGTTNR